MEVELLFVPDCPNREAARRRLDAALSALGRADVEVRERQVSTIEEARRLGMHGSPTLRIDGRDLFAVEDSEPSLSCRLYREEGTVAGVPSVRAILASLEPDEGPHPGSPR